MVLKKSGRSWHVLFPTYRGLVRLSPKKMEENSRSNLNPLGAKLHVRFFNREGFRGVMAHTSGGHYDRKEVV